MTTSIEQIEELVNENNNMGKAILVAFNLMRKVYKSPIDAAPFMDTFAAMMKDEDYIPDKMVEMPGDNPEAEEHLRELSELILGRRI